MFQKHIRSYLEPIFLNISFQFCQSFRFRCVGRSVVMVVISCSHSVQSGNKVYLFLVKFYNFVLKRLTCVCLQTLKWNREQTTLLVDLYDLKKRQLQ